MQAALAGSAVIAFGADTPGWRVLDVLRAAQAAGAAEVSLIVAARDAAMPPSPRPEPTRRLLERLAPLEAGDAQAIIAAEIDPLVRRCPRIDAALATLLDGDRGEQCATFSAAMTDALTACPRVRDETLALFAARNRDARPRPRHLTRKLASTAPGQRWDGTWATVGPKVLAEDTLPVGAP